MAVLLRTARRARRGRGRQPVPRPSGAETKRAARRLPRPRPAAAAVGTSIPDRSPGDEFSVAGREIYLHLPNGSGRTKLTLDYFERRLGVTGTARNWNTLLKLIELTAPGSAG